MTFVKSSAQDKRKLYAFCILYGVAEQINDNVVIYM